MSVYLRLLESYNLEDIFKFRNAPGFIKYCTTRSKIKSIEQFKQELRDDFIRDRLVQFVILNLNKKVVGTIYAYNYNSFDKYAFITVYIDKEYVNKSYGIKSFLILSDFLFKKYKLFKIYFDIYSYNKNILSVVKKCNFSLEGVFKKQKKIGKKRYDVLRYAFYKEDLETWKKRLNVSINNIIK